MKVQVTQENLGRALSVVARIASERNTLPILSNVMLSTVDNRLKVLATNLEVAMTETIGAKVLSEGAITVPARLFQDLVNNIPQGVVTLDLSDNKLLVATDHYESVINGVSAEEFPVMPDIKDGKSLSVSTKLLKKGLQQVVGSASSDDARPVLTAVYMHTHEGKLYIVATDSYRLAERQLQATNEQVSLLVPASSLNDLQRVLQDESLDVEVSYDDQQVRFTVGDTELITRLIDGVYPDYRKLIPAAFQTSASLKKTDFAGITKVSSLFARESAGSVTIKIDPDTKELSIRSVASQLGENTARATADITGQGDVTLNSRYLLDALSVLGGDTVVMKVNGKLDPVLLADPAQTNYTHIIMPVKS